MAGKFKSSVSELQALILKVAPGISEYLNELYRTQEAPRPIGFALVAFEFGDPGAPLAYVTNGDAEALKAALHELIGRLGEGRTVRVDPEGEVTG